MPDNKLQLIINRIISPNTSVQSALMCVNMLAKTDSEGFVVLMNALCDADISKAVSVAELISPEFNVQCNDIIIEKLSVNCKNVDKITAQTFLAIIAYERYDLFEECIYNINEDIIGFIFDNASPKNVCRFMRMFLKFQENKHYSLCEELFCNFLNRYDSSADEELSLLLPVLFENRAITPLSKLITVLGCERAAELYGDGFENIIIELIETGCQSLEMWDVYFKGFFSTSHTDDELLNDGLWFLQINADDELVDLAAMVFFLYAAGKYPVTHPIFEYAALFERNNRFLDRHIRLYEEYIRPFWHTPAELSAFLKATEICNPFFKKEIREGKKLLIKDKISDASSDFYLLEQLYTNTNDCETIIYIFFNTFLKLRLNIEDLFRVAAKYDLVDQMVDAFRDIILVGTIKKYNIGMLVFTSEYYYTSWQHSVSLTHSDLKYVLRTTGQNDCDKLKDEKVEYYISGYYKDQIQVRIYKADNFAIEQENSPEIWAEGIEKLESILVKTVLKKNNEYKTLPIAGFVCDSLIDDCDFSLFTELISNNCDHLDRILEFLKIAEWNMIFGVQDISLPRHYYGDFEKYKDSAVALFKKLFDQDCDIDLIFELYFSSIYKAIVPFEVFILMTDKEKMLSALSDRVIYCKLLEGESRHKCRLMNINCAPVCVIANSHLLEDGIKVPAKCIDYKVYDDGLGKIIFENVLKEIITPAARGELFGYVAQNMKINRVKRERIALLPDAKDVDVRELKFNFSLMAVAIKLRCTSGMELLRLVRIFGNKNPYSFQQDVKVDTLYLYKFHKHQDNTALNNQIVQMVLNTSSVLDMAEIYLNTTFKYCVNIRDFVLTVCKRRPELSEEVSSMFSKWEFDCVTDSRGNLFSYILPEKAVNIGVNYALKSVKCRISVSKNGEVSAEVIEILPDSEMLYPALFCALVGQDVKDILPCLKPHIQAIGINDGSEITSMTYFGNLKRFADRLSQHIIKVNSHGFRPQGSAISFLDERNEIAEILAKKQIEYSKLRQVVSKIIKKYYTKVSIFEMENIVCEITATFIARCYFKEEIFRFLKGIFSDYSYYVRDNGIVDIWIEQLTGRFGEDTATEFEQLMKTNRRYIKNNVL